jgi:hypothetical protein
VPDERPSDLRMMVFLYLVLEPEATIIFDESYINTQAGTLGAEVADLWHNIKQAARREAERSEE